MDSLTQIALGAVIAEAGFRKSLGRRALFFGAFCGCFPDLDVFVHSMLSWDGLQSHRGLSHSLLFLPLITPLLSELGYRMRQKDKGSRLQWMHLTFWALITHPLLDSCTTYGTQLLYPLSTKRFSTDAISIIDLLYTIPLLISLGWALRRAVSRRNSRYFAGLALFLSTGYLGLCHLISAMAIPRAMTQFTEQGFEVEAVRASPPIGLPLLRRVVARSPEGDLAAVYISALSGSANQVHIHQNPKSAAATLLLQGQNGQIFSWFADGFVGIEIKEDTIRLFDARYGLYLQPWWSPFSAQALVHNGQIGLLGLNPRDSSVDMSLELATGWRLMWGKTEKVSQQDSP